MGGHEGSSGAGTQGYESDEEGDEEEGRRTCTKSNEGHEKGNEEGHEEGSGASTQGHESHEEGYEEGHEEGSGASTQGHESNEEVKVAADSVRATETRCKSTDCDTVCATLRASVC